jgi:hypothetical protein
MTKTDDSDDEDLLRSQPAFGQLPSQVASGRGTDGSSILAHPVSQRRPSPPTIDVLEDRRTGLISHVESPVCSR